MPDIAEELLARVKQRGAKAPDTAESLLSRVNSRATPAQASEARGAIYGDAGTEDALPLSENDKAAYIKRLFPGEYLDPGSEVLPSADRERIYAEYRAQPFLVNPSAADPEFTRRTSVAAFDKLFGPRTVGDRQKIEEILAKHAPKEATTGEKAQYYGGQFMEGMNAPAMGYARKLFGQGGVLENPDSLAAAENVANPSRKSIGDGRFEEVRKDVESTFWGRTLSGAANLAGATPGLLAAGRVLSPVVGATAAGPTALGLNALASSGGDVAAAGEGVLFGGLAAGLSIPLKAFISRLPIAMQRPAVDRLLSMTAGGAEFAGADAILHGPDGERALSNFIFGATTKAVGATPGQARAKELTTSRATYPDPVESARGVREGYDRALAEVEAARPTVPAVDPVAEAKATAAQFDAKVAPEAPAPTKPVSEAPVAAERLFHGSPRTDLSVVQANPQARQYDNATSQFGAFFSPSEGEASRYAGKGGRVYAADVQLSRPYEMPWAEFNKFQSPDKGPDGKTIADFSESGLARRTEELKSEAANLRRDLESQGYDGVVVRSGRGRVLEVASFKDVPLPESAPAEAPKAEPAPVAPDAPSSRTLVGKDKRGKEVWEIRGRFYVKDPRGRYGAAHPQEVAEAKASAPKRETITPADDTPVGQNAAGDPLYERADGSRYRMRNDSPNTRPNGYPDFGGDLAPVEARPMEAAPVDPVSKYAATPGYQERSVYDPKPSRPAKPTPEAKAIAKAIGESPDSVQWLLNKEAAGTSMYPDEARVYHKVVQHRMDNPPASKPGKQGERGSVDPTGPMDVVREMTAGPPAETAMFAGGPEAISTKAYEAWSATREGFRGVVDAGADFFSSQKAPGLLRLSPRAWRGVVAAESAPQIAKAAVKVWESEVPNPSWSPKEKLQFEAALTENNRLGAVDNRIADAAAKRTEAQSIREQAKTLGGSAIADALLKKATRLEREAMVFDERSKRAEGKNEYLIGEGKPFSTPAELAEFVSRPDVVEAAKRHQAWWTEMVEPSYKSAQSIEGTEAMPTRGRFFDSRASLVVPPETDAPTGTGGSKAGQTENIKTRKSRFANLAWGDSSRGYEVEANQYLKKALEDVVPKGGWREAVDSLVSEGHGVRLTKPDQKAPTEIAGEPAMKFDIGQQGERVYLPKSLHEALTHIRQVGAATRIPGITAIANTSTHQSMSMAKDNIFVTARAISRVMTLPSTGRPALEIAGNVALWPVMRVIDIAKLTTRALGAMKASPRDRLEMARAGVSEREPMLKRDAKGRVETDTKGNPIEVDANLPGLKWLGPVSNAIDTAARESLATTMKRLKANGVNIDTGPEAMSKYVGQLGRYGRAWYGPLQRVFTDSGINPFFESRRTSRGNAARTMAANPNLTPLDTGTALKLRGVVLSKLVGLMTTTAIANLLTTGDTFGGPSTPIGAISLGKDKDGKRIFFDFWKLMGIRQVARATGIEQALEGLRRGDDAGQVALSALTGAGREAAGFVSGPLLTAMSIGATGSRPDQLIGGQKDASIPAAVDPATLARRRAVEGAKAALPLVGEGAELFAKWFGGENIKDILNAGTEVTPDMVDEFVNLRNTVGVGVGQTDAQASTLHDRSTKGFFFGTYLDAVKEDLRKASPDKIPGIVDKAWRDIDTRDDLSAGDKKKAKSAIQYYARNRRALLGGR